ncbi:MAG: ATP-binding protein [Promethearchaeota archaeon]
MSESIDPEYKSVAQILTKGSGIPMTKSLSDLLKLNIKGDSLDFLLAFKRKIGQTMEELKESIAKYCKKSYSEEEILKLVDELCRVGVMFDQPNRKGVVVYRLLPIARQFEYSFMKRLEPTEDNKEKARQFLDWMKQMRDYMIQDYDKLPTIMKSMPEMDRAVPIRENKETGEEIKIIVNKDLEVPEEQILNIEDIKELIDQFDDIAVGYCYCRQQEEFLGNPCKQIEPSESCFTLGKSARHTAKYGFTRLVSKEEALELLKKCEDAALVHKAYHLHQNSENEEVAICNCCSCCCPVSKPHAILPAITIANYVAKIDEDECIGCGTCVEKCHNQVLELNDDGKAELVGEECIGCGVCAYFCPENAIALEQIPKKRVMILPPPNPK